MRYNRFPRQKVDLRPMTYWKRFAVVLAGVIGALGLVVLVEVMLATRRDYLPTEPAYTIEGEFGPGNAEPLSFVVLGDSTAAGLGASDASRAYPYLLGEMLAERGRRVEMTGVGVSGARVATVLSEQVPLVEQTRPDLVFVGIGANDVTHLTPLSDVRRDMDELLARLEATGATVVVAGAPDMRANAWHEPLRSLAGWRGRAVTAAIESVAAERGITTVPLAKLTAPYFAEDSVHYSEDLFHPGDAGYRRWAEAIYPYLEQALERR